MYVLGGGEVQDEREVKSLQTCYFTVIFLALMLLSVNSSHLVTETQI